MSTLWLGLRLLLSALPVLALLGPAVGAHAQPAAAAQSEALRDPTLAPVQAGEVTPANPGTDLPASSGVSVIVVNGTPHVIIGTRLYAQGEKWGQARIERITETEIWLREGGKLRKLPRFSGIVRRGVSSADVQPACASAARKASKSSRAALPTEQCPAGLP